MECHVGDWFHPLLSAAYVEAQYERRAYAALAKVYAREEKLLQTTSVKRWENHWQKYLVECAAADQAIERYDQWRPLRWQLRALASQPAWRQTGSTGPLARCGNQIRSKPNCTAWPRPLPAWLKASRLRTW